MTDQAQQLGIRIADTADRRASARILIQDAYGHRGYSSPHRRDDSYDYSTFLASEAGRTLGTISHCTNSLPAAEVFGREITALQDRGAEVCEICRQAFEPSTFSKAIFGSLLHVIFLYARHIYRKTDAIVQVNPRHEGYYTKMLGLKAIGDVRMNERVGAPARLLWLCLDEMETNIRNHGGTANGHRNRSLYPYFFSPAVADKILLRIMDRGQN